VKASLLLVVLEELKKLTSLLAVLDPFLAILEDFNFKFSRGACQFTFST